MKKTSRSWLIPENKYILAPEICVDRLKGISILYENDFFDLASFVCRVDQATSLSNQIKRHTVNGVIKHFISISDDTGIEKLILEKLERENINAGSAIHLSPAKGR